jgi:hypothetical protein
MSGRHVVSQQYKALNGENLVMFDMTAQPAGMYMILVETDIEVIHAKWLKQ